MQITKEKIPGRFQAGSQKSGENNSDFYPNRPYWSKTKKFTVKGERKDSLL